MWAAPALGALAVTILAAGGRAAGSSKLSVGSAESAKDTAHILAEDLLKYYHGNEIGQIPGLLPGPPPAGPYFWFNGAVMWATLVETWHYTGNKDFNELILQGLQFQTGDGNDYMPRNFTASMGNDDQGFWAMAALLAAERKFPSPPADQPQWIDLALNVFKEMANPDRWDNKCGGGLRWQIMPTNVGYEYKPSFSNGVLFNLAARLARFTGNGTYSEWAEKVWNWMEDVEYIDEETYSIYDGGHVEQDCEDINHIEFSYNNAIFTLGAAYMYNYTDGDSKWRNRVVKLLDRGLDRFFVDDVAFEVACEGAGTCTTDMLLFKGLLHQWYTMATQLAPFIKEKITPVLKTSAKAAISQCTGDSDDRQCGFSWVNGTYDGNTGANQEISALSAVFVYLVDSAAPPYTAKGGTAPPLDSGNGTAQDGGNSAGGDTDGGNGAGGASGGESAGYIASPYAGTVSAILLCLAFVMANIVL